MIKTVLDTNVIVSGTIIEAGIPAKIIDLWKKGKFILLLSEDILEEIIRVLDYPRIKKKYRITDKKVKNLIRDMRDRGRRPCSLPSLWWRLGPSLCSGPGNKLRRDR